MMMSFICSTFHLVLLGLNCRRIEYVMLIARMVRVRIGGCIWANIMQKWEMQNIYVLYFAVSLK